MRPLRRSLLSFALIGSVILAACGNAEEVDTTSEAVTSTAAQPVESTTAAPTSASPLADLEEYPVLQSTLDDLDSLTPTIETDNPNTRVILYANAAGQRVYKSIYVKRNNRLKIRINGNGPPLFNGAI